MMKRTKSHESLHVKQTLRIYLQACLRHRSDVLVACLLPLANVILGVFVPLFASKVLASIVTRGPALDRYFIWFIVSAIVGVVLNGIGIRRCVSLQARVMQELHDEMFGRLMERSVGFYNNQIGGKLVSDALDFVSSFGQLFNAAFVSAFGFLLTIIIGLAVVTINNWMLGLAIAVLMGGLTYWTILATNWRSDLRSRRLKASKKLVAHVSDNIVNAVTVKTFAQEHSEIAANQTINKQLADIRVDDWRRSTTNETERMGVLLLMQVLLIALLIRVTAHDPQMLATGIFAFSYTLTLINRFFSINTMTRQIEDAFLQASPMTELLQQPVEVSDAVGAQPLAVPRGEITCQNVSFNYADSSHAKNVFTRLDLTIQPGEKIGLVGHSGGGKSTLTRLLLRFDDVTSGTIAIDGQDIRTVTQESLRTQISYVPQEPLLFHRTIKENIAYGNSHATQAEIEHAAEQAYAHGFITKLPEGYDTMVGERGVKLSGGQRQRIAIARAILKNAPILVLDEATSALDSESEKVIQKALWKLMSGRTTVVVAHRLSTIQKMDRILVLSEGRIVEHGSHAELLEKKGQYARLWAHQSGDFIEE